MSASIGFIGLGIMGRPMARRLLEAGHELIVFNRSHTAMAELAGLGAATADTPARVAGGAPVVITMLPGTPEVSQVLTGQDGVLNGARPGTLLIDMSTISPAAACRLAAQARERGLRMLDAPVSGGDVGARQGTLSIMVGGAAEDFEAAAPIFAALGKTITHVGGAGAGQVVKACNQIVVALTIEAVAEALILGSKAGVAPALVLDVLSGGLAANRVMEVRRRNFLGRDFTPGFRVDLHHKDLGIALASARDYGVVLPATALVDQHLESLRCNGQGGDDHSSLLRVLEQLANHQIPADRTQPA